MLIPVSVVSGLPSINKGAPPVTPSTWYDPSDSSTVVLSGDRVTQFNDKTAGGLNASGGTGLFVARQRSGTVPQMLGVTGGGLWTTAISASDITSSAFFVVCQVNLSASRALASASAGGGIDFYVFTDGTLKIDKKGIANMGTTAGAISAGIPYVVGYSLDTNSVTQYINLTGETDVHAQTLTAALTFNLIAWTGWIGEMLFFDSALSAGDATATIQYLMNGWNIG